MAVLQNEKNMRGDDFGMLNWSSECFSIHRHFGFLHPDNPFKKQIVSEDCIWTFWHAAWVTKLIHVKLFPTAPNSTCADFTPYYIQSESLSNTHKESLKTIRCGIKLLLFLWLLVWGGKDKFIWTMYLKIVIELDNPRRQCSQVNYSGKVQLGKEVCRSSKGGHTLESRGSVVLPNCLSLKLDLNQY